VTALICILWLLLSPLPASGQEPARVFRLGTLSLNARPIPHLQEAFMQGLRELGYVEGQNLVVERRFAAGNLQRLDEFAAELVLLKVDVIIAAPTQVVQAAQRATKTIPIVMPVSGDPVGFGLVASLARPGGNVTGLSALGPELSNKQVELVKELVPGIVRVGLLWNATSSVGAIHLSRMRDTAQALSLQLQSLEVKSVEDFDKAFAAAVNGRVGAVLVGDDFLTFNNRARLVEIAAAARLPAIYLWREYPEAGGLISYGPNLRDLNRRAAAYVDKILKGAKPGDLPIEQPTTFDLLINLKAAKALGLRLPQSILLRADQIIQ